MGISARLSGHYYIIVRSRTSNVLVQPHLKYPRRIERRNVLNVLVLFMHTAAIVMKSINTIMIMWDCGRVPALMLDMIF